MVKEFKKCSFSMARQCALGVALAHALKDIEEEEEKEEE
jgi:hypothetical protein